MLKPKVKWSWLCSGRATRCWITVGSAQTLLIIQWIAALLNRDYFYLEPYSILHPDKIRETKLTLLILFWNLKEEIMAQMAFILEWGGKFVPTRKWKLSNLLCQKFSFWGSLEQRVGKMGDQEQMKFTETKLKGAFIIDIEQRETTCFFLYFLQKELQPTV